MVGYVDDATLETQVRVRFDVGLHDQEPDRAEFFYAKCGCYRQLAGNAAYDPTAPGPGPGIATDINFQQLYALGQYVIRPRVSLFAELPVRWMQPKAFAAGGPPGTFSTRSGISDLRAGAKIALVSTANSTVTGQVQFHFPTGNASKGLGTHHASIEPALLYYQRIADRFAVEAQFKDWHPLDGSKGVPVTSPDKFAGDVLSYGVGPSVELVRTARVSFGPVVELVGWHVVNGFSTLAGDASGTNIVNVKFGARTIVDDRNAFYFGYGHALTDATWYDDILRFEFRHSF